MIFDIFSSFDPIIHSPAESSISIFWLFILIPLIVIPSIIWIRPTPSLSLVWIPITIIILQSSRTAGKKLKGFTSIITSLFIIIIVINLIGLIPYVFRYTTHLIITLSLGLPLWLILIYSGLLFNASSFIAHLLPGGAPDWLNPALVLIESVSITVRPVTLSFRLAANISAGHIVLTLIGVYAAAYIFLSIYIIIILIIIQILYILFEVGICIIQSYIFSLLVSLYADDHPH